MKKKIFGFFISTFVTLLIINAFFKDISLYDIVENIKKVKIEYIIYFIILSLIATILRTYRYYILLSKSINFFDIFLITLIRNFSVDLLPARTASLAFYTILLKKKKISLEDSSASFFISAFYDGLALVLMLSCLLFFIDVDKIWIGIYISMGIIFIISILAVFFSDIIIAVIIRLKNIKKYKKINNFFSNVHKYLELHNDKKERIIIFILSILIRLIKYIFVFVLFVAIMDIIFSISVFSKFSFALAGTEMSTLLPIQGVGGFGTWELAFKIIFENMNVLPKGTEAPHFISFAQVGIIIHIISQVWEYSIGILAFFVFIVKNNLQNK